jgi:hypothetical protein
MGWRSRDRIPVGGEIFRSRPRRPWGPPSLLYDGHRFITGGKHPGRGVNHPPRSSAEVKERVELYLYSLWAYISPSRANFALFLPSNMMSVSQTTHRAIFWSPVSGHSSPGSISGQSVWDLYCLTIHSWRRCTVRTFNSSHDASFCTP